jgi:hypothetical protein
VFINLRVVRKRSRCLSGHTTSIIGGTRRRQNSNCDSLKRIRILWLTVNNIFKGHALSLWGYTECDKKRTQSFLCHRNTLLATVFRLLYFTEENLFYSRSRDHMYSQCVRIQPPYHPHCQGLSYVHTHTVTSYPLSLTSFYHTVILMSYPMVSHVTTGGTSQI